MHTLQQQARQKFNALFAQRNPTREEMYSRPDFSVLAALSGMSFGECWDELVKKAGAKKHAGNIILAAEEWYAQLSTPRF